MVIFGLTFLAGAKEVMGQARGTELVVPECSRTQGGENSRRDLGEERRLWGYSVPSSSEEGAVRERIPSR